MWCNLRNLCQLLLIFGLLGVSACLPVQKQEVADKSSRAEGGVVIEAPDGPPGPMAELLAQSVADALVRRGYDARSQKKGELNRTRADFHVSGYAEALDSIHAPTVAALHWILRNGVGNEIAYLTQGVRGNPDAWTYGSPAMLKIVGDEAAADFSVFLGQPSKPPVKSASPPIEQQTSATAYQTETIDEGQPTVAPEAMLPLPTPSAPPPLPVTGGVKHKRDFGLWLDEVTGAPGDGNAALTQAIYEDLVKKKLPFAMTPGLASHYIQGVVDVSVRSATAEHITIVWVVSNGAGEEIGRVSQRNDIVRGSLHGKWGDTAVYAARGGLEGVLAILERDLETSLAQ